jgi:hypothetical protein
MMLLKSGICFHNMLNNDRYSISSIGGISDPVDNGLGNTSEQGQAEEGSPGLAGYNNSSMLAEYNDSSLLVDKGGSWQ